jgi:hypothetical protein
MVIVQVSLPKRPDATLGRTESGVELRTKWLRKKEWQDLLSRALKLSIPDAGVANAYHSCVGDLFIMRESHAFRSP